MKLVVGLGNPGTKYEGTRHNVGFEVIERLVREMRRRAAAGEVRRRRVGMSAGRREVAAARAADVHEPQRRERSQGDRLLPDCRAKTCWWFATTLICPWGSCEYGPRGTDGGQNGLADVIRTMGTSEFPRLRIGIGPVPDRWDPADFVLGKFTADERKMIDVEVARAADAVRMWATEGVRRRQ